MRALDELSPEERAFREETRSELLAELAQQDELAQRHDRRVRALLVSCVSLAAVLVPLGGAILGLAVRLFRLVSGL